MRGIGKTHTIALIYHRLKKREQLEDKLLIAWLKEEEWGVSSWLELLIRIFSALENEYSELYKTKLQEKVESLYQLSSDDATYKAERILKEFIGDKTLLLLTENLDEIFNGLGDIGQKQFRAYLQNYNLITIIATSQSLFAGVIEKESPFYGFFAPKYLDKLTIEAATELLRNIAELQNDKELEFFINSPIGKDRIQAIHHNHQGWTNRGTTLGKLGRLDEAIASYNKALEIKPDYVEAWYNQGAALNELRRFEEAIESYNKALEIKPDHVDAWNSRGIALHQLARLEEAIASYNKALEIKPDHVDAWNSRGAALYELGRWDEAITSYNKAISFNPKDPFAWFNRIEVIFKLNNWDKGFNKLDNALNRFANQKEPYTGDTKEYIKIIWDSTRDIDVWKSRIETLVKTYDKHQVVSNLSKGMVVHIPTLMSEIVSDKLARTWLEVWQSIVGDKLELSIALRFLKIAVEYKETKGDRRILMKLAKEEREILEPLVKIQ